MILFGYSLVVGNPLSVRVLLTAGSGFRQGYEWRATATFLKWNLPASRAIRPRNVLGSAYWPEARGPRAAMTGSLRNERFAHVGAQAFRTIIAVVLAGVLVHVVLKGINTPGFLSKWLSAWGAIALAIGASGLVGNIVFAILQGRFNQPNIVDGILGGVGFGAQFGLLIGAPIAALIALIHRPTVQSFR